MFISKKKFEKIKMDYWTQGFDNGRKKAVTETRKVFIKLITAEVNENPDSAVGLNIAMEIIRKGKR